MKDEIERRLAGNLSRVKSLIATYESGLSGVSGRPSVAMTDILRASVVFLHASLEDLLRSVLAWKLPTADAKHLEDVPLAGEKFRKYSLKDVAQYRGTTVDELIARSVSAWLERSNFNDATEVTSVLTKVNLAGSAESLLDQHAAHLEGMMRRRHWIVHRADRNPAQGSGQFAALSLHPDSVRQWLGTVEGFGSALLNLL